MEHIDDVHVDSALPIICAHPDTTTTHLKCLQARFEITTK